MYESHGNRFFVESKSPLQTFMLVVGFRWNFVVTLVPMWVAPNLITMVGLIINVATSIILMWLCPTATEPVKTIFFHPPP